MTPNRAREFSGQGRMVLILWKDAKLAEGAIDAMGDGVLLFRAHCGRIEITRKRGQPQ